jgi:hypothetical protein
MHEGKAREARRLEDVGDGASRQTVVGIVRPVAPMLPVGEQTSSCLPGNLRCQLCVETGDRSYDASLRNTAGIVCRMMTRSRSGDHVSM